MVLWGLALLSLMAIGSLSLERSARRSAFDADERARADVLAEAGINRAILSLLESDPGRRWRIDGVPQEFEFAGHRMRVSLQDETGKIDLNTTDRELLVNLLISQDLNPQAANELTDKILDWRDPSDAHRLNGAKAEDYRIAGYPYGPRNGAFQTVDELKLVMGMTHDLFKRVEPAITVYSQRPMINMATAPREALLALPTFDAEKADAVLAARSGEDHPDTVADATTNASPTIQPLSLFGLAFAIHVELLDSEFSGFAKEAVVRITGDPRQPYWVLSWRDPASS
jgi:general secretion pathway protein K